MASRNAWIAGAAVVIVIIIIVASVYFVMTMQQPTPTPTKSMTLYEADRTVSGGVQGVFGFNQSSMTSPGPTLNFKVGDVINMTVYNVGTIAHNWAIVSSKNSTATVLFNAHVGTGDSPIAPESHGNDIFTVTQAGNFFYICQVPGHVDLGMWGSVVVTS